MAKAKFDYGWCSLNVCPGQGILEELGLQLNYMKHVSHANVLPPLMKASLRYLRPPPCYQADIVTMQHYWEPFTSHSADPLADPFQEENTTQRRSVLMVVK